MDSIARRASLRSNSVVGPEVKYQLTFRDMPDIKDKSAVHPNLLSEVRIIYDSLLDQDRKVIARFDTTIDRWWYEEETYTDVIFTLVTEQRK